MAASGVLKVVAAAALVTASPAFAGPRDWGKASDIGRTALVAAALGVPAVQGDWRGGLRAAGGLAATAGVTVTLKELIHERRPDRSGNDGFPSGHTSISFASAATLESRYGWRAGLPAFAVATFVGAARVQADKHYWHDVMAGAAIGTASGFLLTSKRDARVRLVPWAGHRTGGVSISARF